MAQTEFLQGEIADQFLPQTSVEGLHEQEAGLFITITTTRSRRSVSPIHARSMAASCRTGSTI